MQSVPNLQELHLRHDWKGDIDGVKKVYQSPYDDNSIIIVPCNGYRPSRAILNVLERMPMHIPIIKPNKIIPVINEAGKRIIAFSVDYSFKRAIKNVSAFKPWDEFDIKTLIGYIIPVFSFLHSYGISHRGIRLSNIFTCSKNNSILLGDFFLTPRGFYQPFEYEPLNSPAYHPQLRVRNVPAHDMYSLGIVIAQLICGVNILHNNDIRECVMKKIRYGSYNVIHKTIMGLCSSAMMFLLQGLLEDDESLRWNWSNVYNWLHLSYKRATDSNAHKTIMLQKNQDDTKIGESQESNMNLSSKLQKIERFHSLYPYHFHGVAFNDCYSLGIAFAHNWDIALSIVISDDKISTLIQWMKLSTNNHNAANRIVKLMANYRQSNTKYESYFEVLLSFVIMNLAPSYPLVYKGFLVYIETLQSLFRMLATHNQNGQLIYDSLFEDGISQYMEDGDELSLSSISLLIKEVMHSPLLSLWVDIQDLMVGDMSVRKLQFNLLKHYFYNSNLIGAGIPRCVYMIGGDEYCYSKFITDSYISTTKGLLLEVNRLAGELGREETEAMICDRNIMSFLIEGSMQNNAYKGILSNIQYTDNKDIVIMGAVLIIDACSIEYPEIDLSNIAEKIYPRLETIISNISRPSIRVFLFNEVSISKFQKDFKTLIYLYLLATGKRAAVNFLRATIKYHQLKSDLDYLRSHKPCERFAYEKSHEILNTIIDGYSFLLPISTFIR